MAAFNNNCTSLLISNKHFGLVHGGIMLLDENKNNDFLFDDLDDLEDLTAITSKNQASIDLSANIDRNTANKKAKAAQETSILHELVDYLKIIVIATIAALFINNFIIVNAIVPTGSMNNTIMQGDRLVGFRLSYMFSKPERGDIIIFKYPDNVKEKFVKRVIGLPGDIVEIKDEADGVNVYINGEILNEPYIREAMIIENDYIFVVPANSYFVMGDNRNDSKDSRYWNNTFVPDDYILAKAVFKYYPHMEIMSDDK